MQFVRARPLTWDGFPELEEIWGDYLFSGGNPHQINNPNRSPKWRAAMTLLAGDALQIKLRGQIGAASMAKWE